MEHQHTPEGDSLPRQQIIVVSVCKVRLGTLISLMLWKMVLTPPVPLWLQIPADQQLSNSYHLSRLSPEMGPMCCASCRTWPWAQMLKGRRSRTP